MNYQKILGVLLLLALLLSFGSCRNQKQIPLIEVDANGQEVITYIPFKGYSERTGKMVAELDEKVSDTLSRHRTTYPKWEMTMFFVGFTVGAGVGLPSVGLEGSDTLQLYFTKQ